MANRTAVLNETLESAMRAAGLGGPAPSATDALLEQIIGPHSAMLKSGRKRASRKSKDPEERARAEAEKVRHHDTLTQIAQILGCEGFTEFCAIGVLHFAKNRLWNGKDTANEKRKEMAGSLRDLSPEQKKQVGEFIAMQAAASFESGLRIGLMTSLWTLRIVAEGKGVKRV